MLFYSALYVSVFALGVGVGVKVASMIYQKVCADLNKELTEAIGHKGICTNCREDFPEGDILTYYHKGKYSSELLCRRCQNIRLDGDFHAIPKAEGTFE